MVFHRDFGRDVRSAERGSGVLQVTTAVGCREGWGELEKFENELHERVDFYSHCMYLKQ